VQRRCEREREHKKACTSVDHALKRNLAPNSTGGGGNAPRRAGNAHTSGSRNGNGSGHAACFEIPEGAASCVYVGFKPREGCEGWEGGEWKQEQEWEGEH
jgi:hypothetical protein